jgi:hypothetical protein
LLELYAHETIGWRRRINTKDNGTPVFEPARPAAPEAIKASVDHTRRLIRNEKGEQVVSEGCVLTAKRVNEGDVLAIDGREWTVQKTTPAKDMFGNVLHYEAYL